jgi:hypothetical protein
MAKNRKPVQDRLFNIRITDTLYQEYKRFCDENSFTMSKRLRRLMEADMERWKLRKRGVLLD